MSFEISKNENNFEGEGVEIDKKSCEFKITKSEQFKIFGEEKMKFSIICNNNCNELNESMTQNNKEIGNEEEKIEKWKNEFEKVFIKDRNDILEENNVEGECVEIDKKSCEFKSTKSEQFKIFGEDDFSEKMKFSDVCNNICNELNESMTQNNKEIGNEEEKIEKWKNEFEKELIKGWNDILEKEFIKEFQKKWENEYGQKFDEIWEIKYEKNSNLKFKIYTFQNGFCWSSYFDLYLKKNINYYYSKFYADIYDKYFKNFSKTANEFLIISIYLFIVEILMKNKTNKIIQNIEKEIEKISLDIYPINYIKDIIKRKFLEKMIYYWKQIYINKSIIEETIKFWLLGEIMEKKNEIRTKEDWDNILLDKVLLIIRGESLFNSILF